MHWRVRRSIHASVPANLKLYAKVLGLFAAKIFFFFVLGTLWGSGNFRSFEMSCLMYGRLTREGLSISTTLRIYSSR
jgi:hypothetical protein